MTLRFEIQRYLSLSNWDGFEQSSMVQKKNGFVIWVVCRGSQGRGLVISLTALLGGAVRGEKEKVWMQGHT